MRIVDFMSKKTMLTKKLITHKRVTALSVALLLIAASSLWMIHATATKNRLAQQTREMAAAQAQRIANSQSELAAKQNQQIAAATNPANTTPKAAPNATTPATTGTKYATSSDPRSTAYSTTPPAPNAASFTTKITHSGQVPVGTLISYNATKGDKRYYGGDLILSTSNISMNTMGGTPMPVDITISSPDGALINQPTVPWDEHSPYLDFVTDGTQGSSNSTWHLRVTSFNNAPTGTYTLHASTVRSGQGADAWEYDAFITVTIY